MCAYAMTLNLSRRLDPGKTFRNFRALKGIDEFFFRDIVEFNLRQFTCEVSGRDEFSGGKCGWCKFSFDVTSVKKKGIVFEKKRSALSGTLVAERRRLNVSQFSSLEID